MRHKVTVQSPLIVTVTCASISSTLLLYIPPTPSTFPSSTLCSFPYIYNDAVQCQHGHRASNVVWSHRHSQCSCSLVALNLPLIEMILFHTGGVENLHVSEV